MRDREMGDSLSPGDLKGRMYRQCRAMLSLALVALAGCGGCWTSEDEKLTREELEKKRREQQESLEMSELVSIPADTEVKLLTAKPGHWIETQQKFKSNREDLQVVAVENISRGKEEAKIPGTNFTNEFGRRLALPKGQTKSVKMQCFIPIGGKAVDPFAAVSTRLTFRTELLSWPLMTPILQSPTLKPANELKGHEYQLVVLGPRALSYDHLTVLDAVYWRGDDLMGDERTRSYYVTLAKPVDGKYSFPSSLLTMTAIAVLVWDDVSPENLSIDQQRAIIDWIHWGGQLVISGPNSWARLEDSFLSPYLPGSAGDSRQLTTAAFSEISEHWMVRDLNPKRKPAPLIVQDGKPVSGVDIQLNDNGQWLPNSGELVAESQVGRGRIVVTSFPMNSPSVYRWPYYSSFFSTGLLRRHPREMRRSTGEDRVLAQFWAAPYTESQHEPKLHTNVRILTRDLPASARATKELTDKGAEGMGGEEYARVKAGDINAPEQKIVKTSSRKHPETTLVEASQWGGTGAGWNDYSGVSYAALDTLRSAAGIELPSRKTILYLLAGYLVCLVPLNWMFFKVLGRLEFAWVAAPLMALVGVVVVTRVARLDIGFARRTTEIAVLEMYGGYERAHLTQYLALYTSLSDDYTVEFPENDSVALPLGNISRSSKRAVAETRQLRTNYGRSEGVTLDGLTVYSNSTEMIHAEQLIDLEGGLKLGNRGENGEGAEALKNDTGIEIKSALLVRRSEQDEIELAWVGDLANKQVATLKFEPATKENLWEQWELDPVTQGEAPQLGVEESSETDALWIGGVLKEMVRKTPLMPGQTRLFGYTNDRTSRLSITPAEDQYDGRCIVVAHLTPQKLGAVVPDLTIQSRGAMAEALNEDEKSTGATESEDSNAGNSESGVPTNEDADGGKDTTIPEGSNAAKNAANEVPSEIATDDEVEGNNADDTDGTVTEPVSEAPSKQASEPESKSNDSTVPAAEAAANPESEPNGGKTDTKSEVSGTEKKKTDAGPRPPSPKRAKSNESTE